LYALLNRAKQRSALFAPFTERRTHMPKLKNQLPKMCRDKNRAFAMQRSGVRLPFAPIKPNHLKYKDLQQQA